MKTRSAAIVALIAIRQITDDPRILTLIEAAIGAPKDVCRVEPIGDDGAPMSPAERARRYRLARKSVTETVTNPVTIVTENVTKSVTVRDEKRDAVTAPLALSLSSSSVSSPSSSPSLSEDSSSIPSSYPEEKETGSPGSRASDGGETVTSRRHVTPSRHAHSVTRDVTVSKPRTPKATRRLSTDWQPSAESLAVAAKLGVDGKAHVAEFVDHWVGKGEARADWDATFRNWVRKAIDYGSAKMLPPPQWEPEPPMSAEDAAAAVEARDKTMALLATFGDNRKLQEKFVNGQPTSR